jgi:hypothetical protein
MKECRLGAGILKEVDRNVGKLHVGLGASRPTENFDPNLAAFPLDGSWNEIISHKGLQQLAGANSILLDAQGWPMRRGLRPDAGDSD